MIPVAHGHRAHALIPGSRLELFEGAGHFPHADDPARFTALLVDFLENTRPGHRSAREQAARIAAHADVGGTIARVGQRLLEGVARAMMDRLFGCLAQHARGAPVPPGTP